MDNTRRSLIAYCLLLIAYYLLFYQNQAETIRHGAFGSIT